MFDIPGLVNPQFSSTAAWASAPQVIGSFSPSKEFATPVYNQVHQQQIGARETTQNTVEIPTVHVSALEIPEFQIVERIQEQIVVIIEVGPQERVQHRSVEQIGDVPVPQIQEQNEEVVIGTPQERFSWRARSEISHRREYHFVWSRKSHLLFPRQHVSPEFSWLDISGRTKFGWMFLWDWSQCWVTLPTFWRNLGDDL